MCQVNRENMDSETPQPIHLKFGMFMITSTVRPHKQNTVAAANKWGWGGHRGEIVVSRAVFHFLFPSTRPQLTLRSVDFRSIHPKMCFGGWCVPLGPVCPGSQIFPFLPKTFFQLHEYGCYFA